MKEASSVSSKLILALLVVSVNHLRISQSLMYHSGVSQNRTVFGANPSGNSSVLKHDLKSYPLQQPHKRALSVGFSASIQFFSVRSQRIMS